MAVAISLFGLNSGAALATVVGVLVEVPVMLSLVSIGIATDACSLREISSLLPRPSTFQVGMGLDLVRAAGAIAA